MADSQGYYRIVDCEEALKEINAFLSGDITDERQSAFLAHAASCQSCQRALKERRRGVAGAAISDPELARGSSSGNPHRLASLNPAIFAGVMLILLGGVVAAMRIGPVDFGLFGQKMQKFDEKEYKSHSRSGRSADETKVVTPEVYREEESLKAAAVDPLTAMQQGMDCFQKGDFKCSVSYFRQVVAGRGPAEVREEARYRMIETCAQLKRCAEVILHTSALQKEWPNSRWTGKAFLRNAECHAAQGDLDYARLVYQNVAAKFPDLADTARAGIGALGTPLQNKPDP